MTNEFVQKCKDIIISYWVGEELSENEAVAKEEMNESDISHVGIGYTEYEYEIDGYKKPDDNLPDVYACEVWVDIPEMKFIYARDGEIVDEVKHTTEDDFIMALQWMDFTSETMHCAYGLEWTDE